MLLDKSTVHVVPRCAHALRLADTPPLRARSRGAGVTVLSLRAARSRSHSLSSRALSRAASWIGFVVVLWIYLVRVYYINGWYIVTYGVGIYLLNNFIGFLSPQARALAPPTRSRERAAAFSRARLSLIHI